MFLSPISETSVLQGGRWDTLGGPLSFPAVGASSCADLRPPAQTAAAAAGPSLPSGTGHVLSCSARWVWQNFRWDFKTFAYGPGNSSAKTKLPSTMAPFLILHGGARA